MISGIASSATELDPASRSHPSPKLDRRPQSQSNEPLPPFQDPNAGHKRGCLDRAGDQSLKRKRTSHVASDDDDDAGQRIESEIVLERSTDFDAVYCDGSSRHSIQEYPLGSGKWYIFECVLHKIRFKSRNPVQGAARHLKMAKGGHNKANMKPQSNELAMRELAVRVRNCDADKATKNNKVFTTEWEAGNMAIERRYTKAGWGVDHAKPGRMYRARRRDDMSQKSEGTYVAMVLPTGDLSSVMFAGSLSDTSLANNIPHCYRTQDKKILGWAEGYEDEGPKVSSRKFAVLYFCNGDRPILPCGPFEPEYVDDLGWQNARDLRWFNWEDGQCRKTNGYQQAEAFKNRMVESCARPLVVSGPSRIVTISYPIPSFATSIASSNPSIYPAQRSARRQILYPSDESESDESDKPDKSDYASFGNIRSAKQLGDPRNPIFLSSDASDLEEADDYLPTELDEIEQLQAIELVPKKEVDELGGVMPGITGAPSSLPAESTAVESLLGIGTGVSLRSGTTLEPNWQQYWATTDEL
ncbi:hypothetical protein B0T25DRAFT_278771 [Lasiosphaeria hispida]|uniref:Uncharacterized protein n=1 Tax=Lasiosphaeria hispida TaxID=260671 RepID=A0AAJ0HB94_9PEZI|nr:hypothetical protein B0T25DRAFT_278771 [Lasiosphaeria hispida]